MRSLEHTSLVAQEPCDERGARAAPAFTLMGRLAPLPVERVWAVASELPCHLEPMPCQRLSPCSR